MAERRRQPNAGDVRDPDLVQAIDHQVPDPIGSATEAVLGVGSRHNVPFELAEQGLFPHDPQYALAECFKRAVEYCDDPVALHRDYGGDESGRRDGDRFHCVAPAGFVYLGYLGVRSLVAVFRGSPTTVPYAPVLYPVTFVTEVRGPDYSTPSGTTVRCARGNKKDRLIQGVTLPVEPVFSAMRSLLVPTS